MENPNLTRTDDRTSQPSELGFASLMLGLFGFVIGFLTPSTSSWRSLTGFELFVSWVCAVTGAVGLCMGIVALKNIKRNATKHTGKGLPIAGIIVSVLSFICWVMVLVNPGPRASENVKRIACMNRLLQLGCVFAVYAGDNGGTLPNADRWCDAILTNYCSGVVRLFVCPSDKIPGARCSYVYNRSITGKPWSNDAPVVVLFEACDAGWNANGGPEMFGKNSPHKGGCNVLFSDRHAEWISWSRSNELKWIASPATNSPAK